MMTILQKMPYPIAGLMLALATLGNVVGVYTKAGRIACGVLSGTLLILLILKIVVLPQTFKEALKMAPVASVLTTLPMGMIIMSTYLSAFSLIAQGIWWGGVLLLAFLMVFFTFKHLIPLKTDKILVSYFVTYVGLVVISVTGKGMGYPTIGLASFYIGLSAYIFLLPLIVYKLVKGGESKEPLKPLVIIFAAPANLLVVGYLKGMTNPSTFNVMALLTLGILTTVFAYLKLPKLLCLPFYPSFSAFTFPLIIGALASSSAYGFLKNSGISITPLLWFSRFQLIVALLLIFFVIFKTIQAMVKA